MSRDNINTVMNWSSGKDAALAYHTLLQQDKYRVTHLLTTLSLEFGRVFMHGITEALLDAQAERMGLPHKKILLPASPDDSLYKNAMLTAMEELKSEGITAAAFGDIFLEDLRQYREQQLAQAGFSGVFPLWKRETAELVREVETIGIEAIIVCVNEKSLDKSFLGKKITPELLSTFPPGVDPCGENGEYHTFVYNAPFFSSAIPISTREIVHKTYKDDSGNSQWDRGFYFLDVALK
ncbi:MAG: ATP-binding protein [Bacteroidota bacterium]